MLFRKFVSLKVVCAKRMTIVSSSYLWPDVWNAGKNQVLVFFNAGKSEQPNNNIPDGGAIFISGNFLGLLFRSGQASGRQIWMALLPFVSGAGENLTVLQEAALALSGIFGKKKNWVWWMFIPFKSSSKDPLFPKVKLEKLRRNCETSNIQDILTPWKKMKWIPTLKSKRGVKTAPDFLNVNCPSTIRVKGSENPVKLVLRSIQVGHIICLEVIFVFVTLFAWSAYLYLSRLVTLFA